MAGLVHVTGRPLVHDSAYATDLDPHLDADALTVRQADVAGRLGAVG